jgi:hypothetical protein
MDTNLGLIELTEKQISNLSSLKTENIKGFAYWHDKKEVVVVSDTAVDVEALRTAVASLPDSYSYDHFKAAFNYKLFSGMLNNVLSLESIAKLSNYMRTLEGYCEWKNFLPSDLGNEKNAQSFVNYLESEGIATALEAGAIRAAFQYQGITI